jgi:hypothetical protein
MLFSGQAETVAADTTAPITDGQLVSTTPAEQKAAIRQQLAKATQDQTILQRRLTKLTDNPVPKPPTPVGARFRTAWISGLTAVVSGVLGVLTKDNLWWIGVLLGLVTALVCCWPFLDQWRLHRSYMRDLEADRAAAALAAVDVPELTSIVHSLDRLDHLDGKISWARTEVNRSKRLLGDATGKRDRLAVELRLTATTPSAFAEALAERMTAFDRAFAHHPHFWWPDLITQRPARAGDRMCIDESSHAQLGLLEGRPGHRLIRVASDRVNLDVSDVWSVFPADRKAIMRLEAYFMDHLRAP